ncbi:MAG: bifunctional glutamate N-acetyltransferase/amino-acid acetyltransferase ArgJ [Candidatus Omnitrophota bacterium]
MKVCNLAILPSGFSAYAISCGIKKKGKRDLAIFYSAIPAVAAGLFTSNKILAAPIIVCKKHLLVNKGYQAIIVNSGNANCFTGVVGLKDAERMVSCAAKNLGIRKESVFVASTGIIGKRMPIEKIEKAIPVIVKGLSKNGIDKAKKAILTTDTFTKEITVRFNIGKDVVTLCGIAKGSGMIAPNMATMLAFIFTDAFIAKAALNKALKTAVENSFNCITVDGCMSTNDSVIVLANGEAKNNIIIKGKHYNTFLLALNTVCLNLAKKIVEDAEGATKFIQIKVDNAKSYKEAKRAALSIANSNLFKTAVFGQNPNYGRIVAAVGACGIDVKEKDLKIKVSPLNKKNINVVVSLNKGNSKAVIYTSDLTPEYIKINAEYN